MPLRPLFKSYEDTISFAARYIKSFNQSQGKDVIEDGLRVTAQIDKLFEGVSLASVLYFISIMLMKLDYIVEKNDLLHELIKDLHEDKEN